MIVVGIDYGTSNSCIAFHNGSSVQVIPWPDKGRTGPSVVYLPPESDVHFVGNRAIAEGRKNPRYCFRASKRLFGLRWTDEDTGEQTARGEDGMTWLRGPDRLYSPAEMAFCTIDEMLDCAEFRLRARPDGAVLTYPGGFGEPQKSVLRAAAEKAGLTTIRLLPEPSAAVFAYNLHIGPIRHHLIYDWGAGTFDVAIAHAGKGSCDTKWTDGEHVGGDDIDNAIVEWLKEEYRAEHGVDLGVDFQAVERLREAAEKAKIDLSTRESVVIEIPLIQTIPARTLNATLTLEKLEELAQPFIQRTLAKCEAILEQANLTKGNIASVILVGGQTNMPSVARAVEAFFGKKPRAEVDPDEAVAQGAATFAAMFVTKSTKGPKMIERVEHDIGFEASKNVFHKVIAKGTVYPLKEPAKVVLTSEADDQPELSIHVLEGEGYSPLEAHRLAAADILIQPEKAGEPAYEMAFDVDATGKLIVTGPNGIIYEGVANG